MTSDEVCIICKQAVDDELQLGKKITLKDVTAHQFCLMLTSNLGQKWQNDDEEIYGFNLEDIKKEVRRTDRPFFKCHYCGENGATIGCCVKRCKISFHLPCALERDCRLEFLNSYSSWCEDHHGIDKPKNVHEPTDLCTICYDEMGTYNIIRSIPLPCCNKNAWCHKLCLQKYAQTSGYFLKCPLCKNSDDFRHFIAKRGVFIPERDAKWETDDSGPNTFYGFEQHTERPTECGVKVCKCIKGRKYQVDIENHRNSLVYCHYCGSHAAHLRCFTGEEFLCEECTTIENRARENDAKNQIISGGNGLRAEGRIDEYLQSHKHLISKFKLREVSVKLIRLTPEELGSTLESSESQYETVTTENQSDNNQRSHKNFVSKFKLREFSIELERINLEDCSFTLEPNDSEHDTANTSSETCESINNQITNEVAIFPVILKNENVSGAKRRRENLPQNRFFDSYYTDKLDIKMNMDNNLMDSLYSNDSSEFEQQHNECSRIYDSEDCRMGGSQIDRSIEYLSVSCSRCGPPDFYSTYVCDDCEIEPAPKKQKKEKSSKKAKESGYDDDLDSHFEDMNNNNNNPMKINANLSSTSPSLLGQFEPKKFVVVLDQKCVSIWNGNKRKSHQK